VADKAHTIAEGVALAAEAVDKGRAAAALEQSRTSVPARA
jgi:anthranilate phosphoribosyltransferase